MELSSTLRLSLYRQWTQRTLTCRLSLRVCSAGDASDHIDSLLHSLPLDLSDEQCDHAEAFICSRANVFSRSEYDIGRTNIILHRIDTSDNSPHFEQLQRHPTAQLPVIDERATYA